MPPNLATNGFFFSPRGCTTSNALSLPWPEDGSEVEHSAYTPHLLKAMLDKRRIAASQIALCDVRLFVTKRNERINPCSSICGHEAGYKGNRKETERCDREGKDVRCLKAV